MLIERKRFFILMPILLLCAFSVIEIVENPCNGVLCIISIIACNIFWGMSRNKDRSTFVLFNITFFTFLVSKLFVEWLDKDIILPGFTDRTLMRVYMYMAVSLICIAIGLKLCEMIRAGKVANDVSFRIQKYSDLDSMSLLLQIVLIAYYVSYPFYILTLLDKATFVSETSYIDLYVNYTSSVPYFFTKIGELNQILFSLFMCIEYRKEKLLVPTGLFLIGSVISLGIGQRNILVLNAVMLAVALMYANKRSEKYLGKSIYTKRAVWFVVLLIPFCLAFLSVWGNARMGDSIASKEQNAIKDFFVSQGGQIHFFAYTVENGDKIWSQKVPYTFASVYNYFRNLFGMLDYSMYSKQYALEGNSLGVTQFFISSPTSLESGKGAGGCYLSELLYDWGMPGVIIGSIFLGWVMGKLQLTEENAPWKNAFIMTMIRWIVYIPRASYFEWIPRAFNVWNVAILAFVYAVVNVIDKGNKHPK